MSDLTRPGPTRGPPDYYYYLRGFANTGGPHYVSPAVGRQHYVKIEHGNEHCIERTMHQRCVIIANPESETDSFCFQIAPIRGLNPGWIWIRFWTKIDQILIKILVGLGSKSTRFWENTRSKKCSIWEPLREPRTL